MLAYPARHQGALIYVDREGREVQRTQTTAQLHVANYRGCVDLDALRPAERAGRWGYLAPDGRLLPAPRHDGASSFHEGRAFVGERIGVGARGVPVLHWRLIDEALALCGAEPLSAFQAFCQGSAPACALRPGDPLDVYGGRRRWGLLSREGSWHTDERWDWLGPFCEGRAAAKRDGKCGFIDTRGAWIVRPEYDLVTDFADGMAQVAIRDDLAAPALDARSGHLTLTPAFIGRFGVVGREGEILHPVGSPAPVLGLRAGQETREGLSVVQIGGKYGYVDLAGVLVVPAQYDFAISFSEGRGLVRRGKKAGFVDRGGREVIPPTLEAAQPFSEGLAGAQVSERIVDPETGKKKRALRWGFVDRDGAWAIPARFGPVSSFHDGLALVWLDATRMGYVDVTGTLVWAE